MLCWLKKGGLALVLLFWLAPVLQAAETYPLTIQTASGGGGASGASGGGTITVQVEIASSPQERARGLMGRDYLPPRSGMLFIFEQPALRRFWMKNVPISLDIIFFDENGRWVSNHLYAIPFSERLLASGAPAQYALELAAGEAARLGIGAGSVLTSIPLQ